MLSEIVFNWPAGPHQKFAHDAFIGQIGKTVPFTSSAGETTGVILAAEVSADGSEVQLTLDVADGTVLHLMPIGVASLPEVIEREPVEPSPTAPGEFYSQIWLRLTLAERRVLARAARYEAAQPWCASTERWRQIADVLHADT